MVLLIAVVFSTCTMGAAVDVRWRLNDRSAALASFDAMSLTLTLASLLHFPTSGSVPADYVDAMDAANYVTVELSKPMGIVFEENDADYQGIFVHSLKDGGAAAANGMIQPGDQLVAVFSKKVSGLPFDDALGAIIETQGASLKLLLFRGTAAQFYGPTGASQEWLDEFIGAAKN